MDDHIISNNISEGNGWPDSYNCACVWLHWRSLVPCFVLRQLYHSKYVGTCAHLYSTKTDCCSNCQPEEEDQNSPLSPDEPCYAVVRPLEWSKQEDVDCRCVCQSISCYDEPELWSWSWLHMESNHGKWNCEVPARISRSDGRQSSRQLETIQADTWGHCNWYLCASDMLHSMHCT